MDYSSFIYQPTFGELLVEYAPVGYAIVAFLIFMYIGHRIIKSAELSKLLSIVGYAFLVPLNIILSIVVLLIFTESLGMLFLFF